MAAIHDLIAQIGDERLGPLSVPEDETRLMRDGFPANLAYFKLDFLDPERVNLKRAFREILPLLWLKAGAVGPRPELSAAEPEPALFEPEGSNFIEPLTHVRLRTLAAQPGSAVAEPDGTHEVEASDIDIERLFQDAGRVLTNGLHKAYWESQAERDSAEVKVELVALCRHAESMSAVEGAAERVFNALYDKHKKAISKLPEAKRRQYDRLRLATAKPADVPWSLPESIDWRRALGETQYAAHLFVDTAGQFACKLVGWEPGLLAEELVRGDVAGWLRNQPHKPWSLEIPYETGGEVRPMFPDFVVVRKVGEQFLVDILEPHDPSRDDNVDKVRGLARFAERHGAFRSHSTHSQAQGCWRRGAVRALGD